jgi:hypothetical protein
VHERESGESKAMKASALILTLTIGAFLALG